MKNNKDKENKEPSKGKVGRPAFVPTDEDRAVVKLLVACGMSQDRVCLRIMGNDGKPLFLSNQAGGILGGISTGQPVVARFAVKPTSSILTPRRSIDRYGHEIDVSTKGRHDPCVGIRAVPIGEAMVACVIADHYLRQRGQMGESPAWPFKK